MAPTDTQMRAAPAGDAYVVRIEGRGTMAESAVFSRFAHCFHAGDGMLVIVDLAPCNHLDSTFLGCLVQLHKRLANLPQGALEIAADNQRRAQLLANLCLDRFFTLRDEAPAVTGAWVDLPTPHDEVKAMGMHIMECHRQLADLGGPQADIFARIADQLGQEIDSDSSG